MFTPEQRDRIRDRIVAMARADARVVSAAEVGSLAAGGGDRWSDLDLTFGVNAGTDIGVLLGDWTRGIEREFGAAHLFDLPYLSTIYRVFMFPGNLQVDLSFTPGAEFGALGPRFRLLFGETVERSHIPGPSARHLFGLAVHHAVRARLSIERDRPWQTEYWVSAVRDQALALACIRLGLAPSYGRGYDELPADLRTAAEAALVRSLERSELLRALGRAIEALLRESGAAPDVAAKVEGDLRGLVSPSWPD